MFRPGRPFDNESLCLLVESGHGDEVETCALVAGLQFGLDEPKVIAALGKLPTMSCHVDDILELCAAPFTEDKLDLLTHYAQQIEDSASPVAKRNLSVYLSYAIAFQPELLPRIMQTFVDLHLPNVGFAVQSVAAAAMEHPYECLHVLPLLRPTEEQYDTFVVPCLDRIVDEFTQVDELVTKVALLLRHMILVSDHAKHCIVLNHLAALSVLAKTHLLLARILAELSEEFALRVLQMGGLVAMSIHRIPVPPQMEELANPEEVHSHHDLLLYMRVKRRLPQRWLPFLRRGLTDYCRDARATFAEWYTRARSPEMPPGLPRSPPLSTEHAGTLELVSSEGDVTAVLLAPFARHSPFIRAMYAHDPGTPLPVGICNAHVDALVALVYDETMPDTAHVALHLAVILNMWGAIRLLHRCLDTAFYSANYWTVYDIVHEFPDIQDTLGYHLRRCVGELASGDRFPLQVDTAFPDTILHGQST